MRIKNQNFNAVQKTLFYEKSMSKIKLKEFTKLIKMECRKMGNLYVFVNLFNGFGEFSGYNLEKLSQKICPHN